MVDNTEAVIRINEKQSGLVLKLKGESPISLSYNVPNAFYLRANKDYVRWFGKDSSGTIDHFVLQQPDGNF